MSNVTQLPPVVFRDARGREWFPVFSDEAIAELKDFYGFDLEAAAAEDDPSWLYDFWGSNEQTSYLMLLTCFRQAGWTPEVASGAAGSDLRAAIPPDDEATTTRAIESLVWALRRRFPASRSVRTVARNLPALRRALKQQHELNEG